MLEELSVRNFALIDSLTLSFDRGFTVLTGETGAGKSIIVGSLSFLLGSKADTEVIRSGCDEAAVSALVSVSEKNLDAREWLLQREIQLEEDASHPSDSSHPSDAIVAIRRIVKSTGRSSIYIQNVPVTRNELAEFTGFLFDLHGQHNHESLLKKDNHRIYLDRFADLEPEAAALNRVFIELAEKRKSLDASFSSKRDRDSRLEILNYAVEEITKAELKKGEIKELEAETQRLGDFEKLNINVNTAASSLFGESSLLSLTRRAKAAMETAASIDNSLLPSLKRLEDLYYEAEDLTAEFRNYRDSLSFDPKRLEDAEERLALLYKLKKKYTPSERAQGNPHGSLHGSAPADEEGILAYKAEALAEIEALSGAEENQDKLKAAINSLEKELTAKAAALSAKRTEAAKRLSSGITEILSRLGMPKAHFFAQVASKAGSKPGQPSGIVCGPWGADDVEFLISANTGEPLKELARIASGGELSRVMLAIKTILCGKLDGDAATDVSSADAASAETLVFDEIDTGIGGEVALAVGEYLARIGKVKQIFCVTHLASIAVRADNHLKVEKKVIAANSDNAETGVKERTITGVSLLGHGDRRQEIARMLAGDSGSAAIAHADELLAKYGRG